MISEIVNFVLGIPSANAAYTAADVTGVTTELTTMITAYLPSLFLLCATLAIARIAYGWVKRALKGR
ncbi:MAG: hypothetical protein KAU07_00805 [Candidatus Andersenbacteria bacterium]|nr:hypothetical protein [Candidatus Andersenbacteria bacterium]